VPLRPHASVALRPCAPVPRAAVPLRPCSPVPLCPHAAVPLYPCGPMPPLLLAARFVTLSPSAPHFCCSLAPDVQLICVPSVFFVWAPQEVEKTFKAWDELPDFVSAGRVHAGTVGAGMKAKRTGGWKGGDCAAGLMLD